MGTSPLSKGGPRFCPHDLRRDPIARSAIMGELRRWAERQVDQRRHHEQNDEKESGGEQESQ